MKNNLTPSERREKIWESYRKRGEHPLNTELDKQELRLFAKIGGIILLALGLLFLIGYIFKL